MGDKNNVVNQSESDAKHSRKKENGQPKSIDNGVSAGEVTENMDAAAANGEHKEDGVDSSPLPSSANHLGNDHSSDSSSSPRSIDSQLHAADEVQSKTDSNAEQQERLKSISTLNANRIFQPYY